MTLEVSELSLIDDVYQYDISNLQIQFGSLSAEVHHRLTLILTLMSPLLSFTPLPSVTQLSTPLTPLTLQSLSLLVPFRW